MDKTSDDTTIIFRLKSIVMASRTEHEKHRRTGLSKEQAELLVAAVQRGPFQDQFRVVVDSQSGKPTILAGDIEFPRDGAAPAACLVYLDAFKCLCQRGFVEDEVGNLFTLTVAGFGAAKEIIP